MQRTGGGRLGEVQRKNGSGQGWSGEAWVGEEVREGGREDMGAGFRDYKDTCDFSRQMIKSQGRASHSGRSTLQFVKVILLLRGGCGWAGEEVNY